VDATTLAAWWRRLRLGSGRAKSPDNGGSANLVLWVAVALYLASAIMLAIALQRWRSARMYIASADREDWEPHTATETCTGGGAQHVTAVLDEPAALGKPVALGEPAATSDSSSSDGDWDVRMLQLYTPDSIASSFSLESPMEALPDKSTPQRYKTLAATALEPLKQLPDTSMSDTLYALEPLKQLPDTSVSDTSSSTCSDDREESSNGISRGAARQRQIVWLDSVMVKGNGLSSNGDSEVSPTAVASPPSAITQVETTAAGARSPRSFALSSSFALMRRRPSFARSPMRQPSFSRQPARSPMGQLSVSRQPSLSRKPSFIRKPSFPSRKTAGSPERTIAQTGAAMVWRL